MKKIKWCTLLLTMAAVLITAGCEKEADDTPELG